MKTFLIFMLMLFSFSGVAQSNRQQKTDEDIEILEKLYKMNRQEANEETLAQEKIFSYKNETSEKIRQNISKISNEEYKSLSSLQKNLWNQINDRLKFYSSATKFLSKEINLLNSYREKVLNRLYEYINNSEENSPNEIFVSEDKNDTDLNNCLATNYKISELNNKLKNENEILRKQNESLMNLINNSSDLKQCEVVLDSMCVKLNLCLNEKNELLNQNGYLKQANTDLINNSKELTLQTTKAAKNLEKSLKTLEERDLKILKLQDALTKKDSITSKYIEQLKDSKK